MRLAFSCAATTSSHASSNTSRSSATARIDLSWVARGEAIRASKSLPTYSSRPLSSTRAAPSLLSSARSTATATSSRSITSQALLSTSGRGSGAWLDGGRVLGPLRAISAEALGIPDDCRAGTALAATTSTVATRFTLGMLRAGSDGAGYSGAAAALGSGQVGTLSSGPTGALGSGAGALGPGAGAGLGCLWPPAGSLGGLKTKRVSA
ncbi:uncharacterized protein LOC133896843 [Phragmites australis]|uniref:uncharacterized protein LOC133896843 n=1 Tax=Phragmites australis TaxID=29695 RepID=UPI002D7654BA|nr:uncharacterized protein LOC133896843 [Phragmites australis]